MGVSQNGWPASSDKRAIGIVDVVVPDTDISLPGGLKGGDVATVLMWVAAQFHTTVEPIRRVTSGGYKYRTIIGKTTLSNHASGTAMDLNWDRHPLGAVGTFTTAQVGRIREILAYCEGAVRWGGTYSGRRDEMHFEINTSPGTVARIAQKIRTWHPTVLPLLKIDGDLGPKTIARWQKIMGTKQDGVISTPSALVAAVQVKLKSTVDSSLKVDGVGIYQNGKRYKTVGALQRYLKVPVDERLSTPVSETVKQLQLRLNEDRF